MIPNKRCSLHMKMKSTADMMHPHAFSFSFVSLLSSQINLGLPETWIMLVNIYRAIYAPPPQLFFPASSIVLVNAPKMFYGLKKLTPCFISIGGYNGIYNISFWGVNCSFNFKITRPTLLYCESYYTTLVRKTLCHNTHIVISAG